MSSERRSRASVVGELLLVAFLLTAWVLAWIANIRPLDSFSPGGRSLFLNNWFTVETLTPSLIVGIVAIGLLPLRHRFPLIVLFAIGVPVLVLEWFYPLVVSFSVTFALKIAVFWVAWKVRQWWIALALVVPVVVALGIREFQINERFQALSFGQDEADLFSTSNVISLSAVLEEVLFFAVVIVGGLVIRRVAETRAELEERNRELVVERAKASEAAVLDERLRISRELHDVVAHHVTTMTVHAGASRQLVATNPDAATESLKQVEESGRVAVQELHQLLGFLRNSDSAEDSDDRSPTPSLRHLSTLVGSVGSKLDCEVNVDGDLATVPSAVDLSAYRIIQEALTNTMKHSAAKSVVVDLVVGHDLLTLAVHDDGPAIPSSKNGSVSGGHGLVGMRERASVHGGEVEVGPAASGSGWQVEARLPFGGSQ